MSSSCCLGSSFFESQQRIVSISHAVSPLELEMGLAQCMTELGFDQRTLASPTLAVRGKRTVVLGLALELSAVKHACRLTDDDIQNTTMVGVWRLDHTPTQVPTLFAILGQLKH
jgi:hypothetical protein